MDVKTIMKALTEKDNTGKNMTTITVSLMALDPETREITRTITEVETTAPVANLYRLDQFTTVTITYPYSTDTELASVWKMLEEYGEMCSEAIDEDSGAVIPILRISMVPMSLNGAGLVLAFNPKCWNLQPVNPANMECCQIRMLFDEEAVKLLENRNIDVEQMEQDARTAAAAEQLRKEAYERREAEKKAEDAAVMEAMGIENEKKQ